MGRSRLTGETVDIAKVNVEDILSYITDLATDAGYVEEPSMLMAAQFGSLANGLKEVMS